MSFDITTTPSTTPTDTYAASTTETAKHVASRSAEEAKQLGGEALDGARQLVRTGRSEVRDQLQSQTDRASSAARNAASQLFALANGNADAAGRAQSLARDAGQRLQGLAEQLDREGIDGLTRRASDFARRRPIVFLGGMALAGFLAGRYAKVLMDHEDGAPQPAGRLTPTSPTAMGPPPIGSGPVSGPIGEGPTGTIASGTSATAAAGLPTSWSDR